MASSASAALSMSPERVSIAARFFTMVASSESVSASCSRPMAASRFPERSALRALALSPPALALLVFSSPGRSRSSCLNISSAASRSPRFIASPAGLSMILMATRTGVACWAASSSGATAAYSSWRTLFEGSFTIRFLWNRTKRMSRERIAMRTRAALPGGPARGFCGDIRCAYRLYGGLQALPHLYGAKYEVGYGRHEVDLVVREFARYDRLGVQYPEGLLAEEYGIGVHGLYPVLLLFCLRVVPVAAVLGDVVDEERFSGLDSRAGYALAYLELRLAYRLLRESVGRPQYEVLVVPEVNGADVDPEPPRGLLGHTLQDLLEVVVRRGQHAYLFKGDYLLLLPVGLLLGHEPATVVKGKGQQALL